MNVPNLIIVGGGGQANVILDSVDRRKYREILIEDPYCKEDARYGVKVIKDTNGYDYNNLEFVVALGDNFLRCTLHRAIMKRHENVKFATIIHPTAYVSDRATIGEGTVVCGGAFIGPETSIGRSVIINTQSSADHDCILADFCSLGPNAALGGNVSIGERSIVAISATVIHGAKIGDDNLIGANSLVLENINSRNQVWYGSPAKKIRQRKTDEKYL